MKLIIGLGNPGKKYEKTRHNSGFMVLDHLLKDLEPVDKTVWEESEKLKSATVNIPLKTEKVILAKPKTYMNNSGMAVGKLVTFYKVKPEDIWVVYDELDLPLGSMKIRFGGASAGHHGIDSIMEKIGTDQFWRFRIGIGVTHNHDEMAKHNFKNAEDFVLGGFTGGQARKAKEMVKRAAQALRCALEEDIHAAMNKFNTK